MPCCSIEVYLDCLCYPHLLLLTALCVSISHCWCPLPHHYLLLWCSYCCSSSFLQKINSFLNQSICNWFLFCSLQGNNQVWCINLFVFQRPFQQFTNCFPSLNSYKVIFLTTIMLFCYSFSDHFTSDWCFFSLFQVSTKVLYINILVFQSTFQCTIHCLQTPNGPKVIPITTTMVNFFTSFTLFLLTKSILKLC